MKELGEIAIFRNIVFKRRACADHASLTGRPCIILSEDVENLFLLPLSSHYPGDGSILKYRYGINTSDIEMFDDRALRSPIQVVNMDEILEKSIFGYESIGQIKRKVYLKMLLELKKLKLENLEHCRSNYEIIKQDIDDQIKYLSKKR